MPNLIRSNNDKVHAKVLRRVLPIIEMICRKSKIADKTPCPPMPQHLSPLSAAEQRFNDDSKPSLRRNPPQWAIQAGIHGINPTINHNDLMAHIFERFFKRLRA